MSTAQSQNQNKSMQQSGESDRSRSFNSLSSNSGGQMKPSQDILDYVKAYAREKPDVAALWCFGIGFVLGWKIKPW